MVARLWLLLRGFISGWGGWGALKMTLYSVFKIYGKTHFRLTVWLGWGCRVPLTRPFLYARPLRRSTWGWSWERKAHSQATFSRPCVVQASVCCLVTEVALRVTVSAPLSTGYFLYLDSVLLDFIHNTSFREDVPNPPWGFSSSPRLSKGLVACTTTPSAEPDPWWVACLRFICVSCMYATESLRWLWHPLYPLSRMVSLEINLKRGFVCKWFTECFVIYIIQ